MANCQKVFAVLGDTSMYWSSEGYKLTKVHLRTKP